MRCILSIAHFVHHEPHKYSQNDYLQSGARAHAKLQCDLRRCCSSDPQSVEHQFLFHSPRHAPVFTTYYLTDKRIVTFDKLKVSCTCSFFKYYQFQPRLQIVNKTLASAMIHIFHFMVLFSIIHVTFSFIGYLNFGTQNRDFSTLGNAMMVCSI